MKIFLPGFCEAENPDIGQSAAVPESRFLCDSKQDMAQSPTHAGEGDAAVFDGTDEFRKGK